MPEVVEMEPKKDRRVMDEEWKARVDAKLDKMVELLTHFARLEERQVSSSKRLDHLETRLDRVTEKVDKVVRSEASSSSSSSSFEGVITTVLAVGLGILGTVVASNILN